MGSAITSSTAEPRQHRPAPPAARYGPAAVRATSAGAIYGQLRDAIVGMDLPPRTPLQDKVLSTQFGVSRTPVREALIRLAEDGLVDIFPQSGTFVSRIPITAIPEAVLIRQALEGVTVEAAAGGFDEVGLARLDDALAYQQFVAARGETRAFHESDEAFHALIASVSGHPGIWRMVKEVKVQIDRARRLTLPAPGRMDQVIGEHRAIRDAIAARDVAGARVAMTAHLSVVIPDVAWLRARYPDHFV